MKMKLANKVKINFCTSSISSDDDDDDGDDNEKFEAAMPFVIIRGNINGQIRHGISCPAYQSKKGNLSNLSSPHTTFS